MREITVKLKMKLKDRYLQRLDVDAMTAVKDRLCIKKSDEDDFDFEILSDTSEKQEGGKP